MLRTEALLELFRVNDLPEIGDLLGSSGDLYTKNIGNVKFWCADNRFTLSRPRCISNLSPEQDNGQVQHVRNLSKPGLITDVVELALKLLSNDCPFRKGVPELLRVARGLHLETNVYVRMGKL